jgi:hypothetical protein
MKVTRRAAAYELMTGRLSEKIIKWSRAVKHTFQQVNWIQLRNSLNRLVNQGDNMPFLNACNSILELISKATQPTGSAEPMHAEKNNNMCIWMIFIDPIYCRAGLSSTSADKIL